MTYQQAYKAHYSRVVRESLLSSFIISLVIGLGAASVIAIITVFTDFYGLWVSIGVAVGLTAILTPVFYFVKFRPDEKTVAQKLDRLGFEERAITMLELQNDDSEIAKLQRNDALAVITASAEQNGGKIANGAPVKAKLEAVGLSTKMIIIVSIVAVVAITAFILTGLPKAKVKEFFAPAPTYTIGIDAGERGYLTDPGKTEATSARVYDVKEGDSAPAVVINAKSERTFDEMGEPKESRYFFMGWDDGYVGEELNPTTRKDEGVRGAYKVFATYGEVDQVVDDDPDQVGSSSGDGQSNSQQDQDDRPPKDDQNQQGQSSPDVPPEGDPSDGAAAPDTSLNGEIINNEIDYREVYQMFYDQAMEMLANGEEIPAELRSLIANYFGVLV